MQMGIPYRHAIEKQYRLKLYLVIENTSEIRTNKHLIIERYMILL